MYEWIEIENKIVGCGSNSCLFKKTNGQGTNGPCTCLYPLSLQTQLDVKRKIKSLEMQVDSFEERVLDWRGISKENICPSCGGSGKRMYPNTTTWHGGIGGQALTLDICDECWGSGDISNKWLNLKKIK